MSPELPPDYEAFKADVVSDLQDDDWGVYEVWWRANHRYPELSLSTRLVIAESVVSDLLGERRITLFRRGVDDSNADQEAVTDAEATLRDWATWVPRADPPSVWITDSRGVGPGNRYDSEHRGSSE